MGGRAACSHGRPRGNAAMGDVSLAFQPRTEIEVDEILFRRFFIARNTQSIAFQPRIEIEVYEILVRRPFITIFS